jgi:predicted ATP-dependent endonuclease of OLD family
MKLLQAQVRNFRNILDSGLIEIEKDITCLVGKNESGKTAFLHPLYLSNPARGNVDFSVHYQYPAWLEKRDRLKGIKLEKVRPIAVKFLLDDSDVTAIEAKLGSGVLKSREIGLERDYSGELFWSPAPEFNENAFVQHIVSAISLPSDVAGEVGKLETTNQLVEYTDTLAKETDNQEAVNASGVLKSRLKEFLAGKSFADVAWSFVQQMIPKFFYYHQFSNLPYSADIKRILQSDEKSLKDDELTARALLRLAAADNQYLLNPDYERRKRELENVSNALTQDVLKYWTQNPELRVLPDITQKTVNTPQGQQAVIDELKIRIWDQRHSLSLPFNEHSTGFQWFFSFLAAFSEYEFRETPVIILLDEPALGLHAKAQGDFLRFIEERLAPRHQVIYTTHSPFMIQPGKLERVRLVEDTGQEAGAKVSKDVMTTDPDTLFPLQGALGYDIAQHLFIREHNLVVEGTSDFTYLTVISDFLKSKTGWAYLDERWSVVPVGGADYIPSFVALLGNYLDVTVLVDSQKAGHQRLINLASQGYLHKKRIVTIGEVLGRKLSDIEDVFTIEDYLRIYNKAFGKNLRPDDLKGSDPIVNRIARHEGIEKFDHGQPADTLLRYRDELLPKLSEDTLKRFEKLFVRINETFDMK